MIFHILIAIFSLNRFVCLSVCPSVRLSVCVFTFEVPFKRILPPLPKVGCPIFLEIRNPWGKVMERSGLIFEHFCLKIVKKRRAKKTFFFADFAGLFQWGGYITTWGGYIEIWGGYIGMMRVLAYSWSTLLWHRCYYPHRSRDSVSPVCGIFT